MLTVATRVQLHCETLFDGRTFNARLDSERLTGQLKRVHDAMAAGGWLTLDEIAARTGDHSSASISARIRDMRKSRFGGHQVERRRRGEPSAGLWEYRLIVEGVTR